MEGRFCKALYGVNMHPADRFALFAMAADELLFGFASAWTVCEQNRLLSVCFGLSEVGKA